MIASTLAASLAILTSPVQEGVSYAPAPYSASTSSILSPQDRALVQQGLATARARDVVGTQSIAARIADPTARKLVEWALADTSDRQLPYYDLQRANIELAQWPKGDSRRAAGERAMALANPPADQVLAFFNGNQPSTVDGAMALAGALEQTGQAQAAQDLIRNWWRTESFEEAQQSRLYARWGSWLTSDDHATRLNMLLLGPHGPATRAMVALVPADRQQVANVVMNLRTAYAPDAVVASLSPDQAYDPAVVLERVRLLRSSNRQAEAFPLLRALPAAPSHREGQNTLWSERRNYFLDALQQRNPQAAYDAMAGHGFPSGERKVDAEFFAGWVALTKLNDPARAAQHFETLRQSSSTPITQGRALYWLGRAAEASGDASGAQAWYQAGAAHWQTFYGQLAMEKSGQTTLSLPADPSPGPAEVQQFEANEVVRATRILADLGERNLVRVFAYHLDDSLPSISDMAQLFDLVLNSGDQFGAMMVGRASSQRGMVMPERMYPIRVPTAVPGAAPLEFTLAITRQESSFDRMARSSADARGMMQFLPATAQGVARRIGLPYSADRLWDADYNMQLGSYHLAELTNNFGGSQLLATIGYNAGPARPPQWVARCGEPRANTADPIDFIECAPFTETRNYMMRVMENMQVYRARLNGGTAQINLSADIARGTPPYSGPRPYQP